MPAHYISGYRYPMLAIDDFMKSVSLYVTVPSVVVEWLALLHI
jgi:hypothetical protein